MSVGGADAIRDVEGDPAETGNKGLRPGVAGILVDDPVVPAEIAADIARRVPRWRAAAMKIWVKSWQTPRLSAKASAAVVEA
jgi:hypothetical protein